MRNKCTYAVRAPYFCADRNREKNRWEPFRLGSQTLLNSQRDKFPNGHPYCANLYFMQILHIFRHILYALAQ